jgi:hypothetical protein
MKAEHRKELQTNELADWLGRTIQNIKSANRSVIVWSTVVVVLLAVVGYLVYNLITQPSSSSKLLISLQEARDLNDLKQLADKNPGTIPARTARFVMARMLYQEAIRDLPSSQHHDEAIAKLVQVRDLCESLANECRDIPVLSQEALMWTARAEEALIGSSNPANPREPAGTLDRAIEFYQKLGKLTPETFETKAAAGRAKQLEDKRSQIEAFYVKLNEQAGKAKK